MGKMINFAFVNAHGDFTKVLTAYGFEFTQKGQQIRLCCPFHEDNNPSLSITLEETDKAQANTFHCFGCAAKGSVIDFVKELDGSDLRTAAAKVAELSGCALAPPRGQKRQARKPAQEAENRPTGAAKKKSVTSTGKGHKTPEGGCGDVSDANQPLTFALTLDPSDEAVLRRLDPEAAEHFGVGLLDRKSRSMMAGRICIPIHNPAGDLVAYAGRWPDEVVPDGEDKYLFPPRFNKLAELYNLHRLEGAKHITIVEGFFSAMRLDQLGVPVVALMGTALSADHIALLHQVGVKSALLLLDGDDAGRTASETVAAQLVPHLFVRAVQLPDGASPDDLAQDALAALLPFPLRNQL